MSSEKWTVENVPLPIRPLFWIYGYGLGILLVFVFAAFRLTCRFRFENEAELKNAPAYIACVWHDRTMAYFMAHIFHSFKKQIWINHPDAYMKPIHVVIRMTGVEKLILGSSGRGGREAADKLCEYLKAGYSTMINPDGPYGPKYTWRKGAFHLSKQSGVPILPIAIEVSPYWKWLSWDQKLMPYPFFSKITIRYGTPLQVSSDDFQSEMKIATDQMGQQFKD